MTNDIRESEVEDYNEEQYNKALEEFNKGPVPKMKAEMEQILEELLERLYIVKCGKVPDTFPPFSHDALIRILCTQTYLEYPSLSFDEVAAEDNPHGTFEDVSNEALTLAWTPEHGLRCKVVTALQEYLYSAAILAKHLNPASPAATTYLRARRITSSVFDDYESYCHAAVNQAVTILRLERVATGHLADDLMFAALPAFVPPKPKKPKKTPRKRTGKATPGNSK